MGAFIPHRLHCERSHFANSLWWNEGDATSLTSLSPVKPTNLCWNIPGSQFSSTLLLLGAPLELTLKRDLATCDISGLKHWNQETSLRCGGGTTWNLDKPFPGVWSSPEKLLCFHRILSNWMASPDLLPSSLESCRGEWRTHLPNSDVRKVHEGGT